MTHRNAPGLMGPTPPPSPAAAIERQHELRKLVCLRDEFSTIKTIAGIDVGYDVKNKRSKCALVLMDIDSLAVKKSIIVTATTPFPYIPGLLSFREAPVILQALEQLAQDPDILFIDGHGIAHPRRLGIAAHIGVLTGLPAIGIAKSVLCGTYTEPDSEKGAFTSLVHKGENIGTVYRSRTGVKPIFISPGHRITHATAVTMVEKTLTRYRLPEPTRQADKLSKVAKTAPYSPLPQRTVY